jgi:hypothetical protein
MMRFSTKWLLCPTAFVAFVLLVSSLLWAGPASAQQPPDTEQVIRAAQFLATKLGQSTATVQGYSFQYAQFADSALGCVEAGQSYTTGPFLGYILQLKIAGATYDVRVAMVAKREVFAYCGPVAELAAVTATIATDAVAPAPVTATAGLAGGASLPLNTYRGNQFSLPYPAIWNITERAGDVYFGLAATPICNQPGMLVALLGPDAGRTPDTLLAEYTPTLPRATFSTARTNIKQIGLSTTYVMPCADGTARLHRVSFFTAYGNAFRVVQFAPEADYPLWEASYLKILNAFGPATAAGGGSGQKVIPPGVSPLALLVHQFNGQLYAGTLVDLPGQPLGVSGNSLAISPRGDTLLFVYGDALYVISPEFLNSRRLAEGLDPTYAPTWSGNSTEIAYVDAGLRLQAISLASGAIRTVSQLAAEAVCPPPPSFTDPSAALLATELGQKRIYWSLSGLIYFNLPCGAGLGQVPALGGAAKILDRSLRQAELAPDESAFIGVLPDGNLAKLQLNSGQVVPLPALPSTVGAATALAWRIDSRGVYVATALVSAQVDGQVLLGEAYSAQLTAQGCCGQLTIYKTGLYQLDLTSNALTALFEAEGLGIGRIAPAPDGSGLLFSFVPDSRPLLEALSNNVSAPAELLRLRPRTMLYWLPAAGGPASLLAMTSAALWGSVGSAPAPTPTGGPPKTVVASSTPRPTWTPFLLPTATSTPRPTSPFGAGLPTNTPRPSPTAPSLG